MIFDYIEENGYVILSKEKFQALEKEKEAILILNKTGSDRHKKELKRLGSEIIEYEVELQKLKEGYERVYEYAINVGYKGEHLTNY